MTGTAHAPHIKKVLVFCGASQRANEVYKDAAEQLGARLARGGYDVIYGGGTMGLMGRVSKAALENGAWVKGVVPRLFHSAGARPQGTLEGSIEEIVENIVRRKEAMIREADAAIALPGGFGTLDEIYEMLIAQEMKVFGEPDAVLQPMIVVNINGFFDGIKMQLERSIQDGFIRASRAKLLTFVDTVEEAVELLDRLNNHAPVIAGQLTPHI